MGSAKSRKRVVVAMSGGVDSSTAAALLLAQGYEVIGVCMQLWTKEFCGMSRPKSCCSLDDLLDARSVANRLGIPFYVFDFSKEFQAVIEYFCSEYAVGRTPNPCIVCNHMIKFGPLLQKALQIEADFVATGHYAKVEYDSGRNRYILKEADDKSKDQSYVLFGLSQKQLSYAMFPMGEVLKTQAREKSRQLQLATHNKPDSQEICFIWDNDYRKFLETRFGISAPPGPITDRDGNLLGEHKGLPFYTIGQRRGLGIAAGRPLYIVDIDRTRNRLTVGSYEDLKKKGLVADGLNWIAFERLNGPMEVSAKIRYAHPKANAVIHPISENEVKVVFEQPQPAITPGQAVVFYRGDEVLGGGWIR